MRVGSLFSGIGGLDLGLERAGMTVVWQSEIDPYASRVLTKHWPHVPNLGDITTIDWSSVERPDLICGGYPCQPFSSAGRRAGESDPRHLWPYFHNAIRHLRPRYALLENVPGHFSMGFGRVLGDLAEIGYDTEWCSIPAAAVGAPHLRWRIFAVAHLADAPELFSDGGNDHRGSDQESARQVSESGNGHGDADVADTDKSGSSWRADQEDRRSGTAWRLEPQRLGDSGSRGGRTQGGHWASEPDVGRVAHGVPARVDRLRCLGNAVVPQVAEWIGKRLMESVGG